MTPPITTTAECADALERIAETLTAPWRWVVREIPSSATGGKYLDATGSLAASASADILAAGDKIRAVARTLRAIGETNRLIGQGAACAEEQTEGLHDD